MMRFLAPLGIFALLAVLLGFGLTLKPAEVPSPLIGRSAPAFEASALRQPQRTISLADITGEVAVVNVWASWCVACLDEHPYIMALAEHVPVYGLNYKDEREAAIAWLDRHGDAYVASAFDPEGRVGLDWGVYGVPETYLLDANGVIRYKHIGAITERTLAEQLLPRIRRLKEGE
jgi:cytochrome c biogenesis protein CcmG/thiol:disulfide interchange protein DsbE